MEPLRHLRPLPSTTAGLRSTCFDRLPYGCLLFMYRLDLTSGTSNFARSHSCTGSKTPGRGGSRDTHETDTRTSQTNLKTNPTHRLTRQTTPKPRDARVATHHTTHPIKRSSADVVVTVMATAPGRGSSEGASPTASVTALLVRVPRCTGRRGGKRLRHPRAASGVSGKSVTNIASTKVGPQVPGSHRAEKPPPPFYRYDVTLKLSTGTCFSAAFGTDGRGPPPQSEHRRQSISWLRRRFLHQGGHISSIDFFDIS